MKSETSQGHAGTKFFDDRGLTVEQLSPQPVDPAFYLRLLEAFAQAIVDISTVGDPTMLRRPAETVEGRCVVNVLELCPARNTPDIRRQVASAVYAALMQGVARSEN